MKASAVETLKYTQGLKKNADTFTITTTPSPSRQHLHDTRASHHTRPKLTYTAMHCDTNRNRKASSEEKISKTEKSKLRKAGSGISRSELYAVVSVSVCPSLSLSLSRSLSVRVCLQQNLHLRCTTNPLAKMGFRVCEPCPRFVLVQGQLHMSVEQLIDFAESISKIRILFFFLFPSPKFVLVKKKKKQFLKFSAFLRII